MSDDNKDKVFQTTIPLAIGKNLKYCFIYQNGSNFSADYVGEKLPAGCSNSNGFRTLQVSSDDYSLPAVLFNSCEEALPPGIDITDLEDLTIFGSNDDEPWINGGEGAGSPPGERIEMLIDNDVNTKYLIRAIDSWIDIVTDSLSLVIGYTITSANDAPARDPRNWQLLGWNDAEQKWTLIHEVQNNPSWTDFFTPRSWSFDNDNRFKKYRLHITEINGDSQGLMQMAELQIWASLGETATGLTFPDVDYDVKIYPNPFSQNTRVSFSLPKQSGIKLEIYDAFGRKVDMLLHESMESGIHRTEWDASGCKPGIYFCRIAIGNLLITKKLILND
jgi:hypothetical protein